MTRQEIINNAVAWALGIAQDSKYGYDQENRWGPNYDCSSFVISAWQQAGVPVKTAGATFTGNMYFSFIKCGFKDVTNLINRSSGVGLEKGDVLLNHSNHTEMYIGNGKCVKASINEYGKVTGGKSGDQTGREIYVANYYNYPWDCVLRYMGDDSEKESEPAITPIENAAPKYHDYMYYVRVNLLKYGDHGPQVANMQNLLAAHGFYKEEITGWYDKDTMESVKQFQKAANITVDGDWGGESFGAMWNFVK